MAKYQLDTSDSDYEDDFHSYSSDDKIFTPEELTIALINDSSNKVALSYNDIKIIGDICDIKLYKGPSAAFKLKKNGKEISCYAPWNSNVDMGDIKNLNNTNCIILGSVIAKYFGGSVKYEITVISVELETKETNITKLKDICNERNYFSHKKCIDWNNINNIGIISKIDTQGSNDFKTQFGIPINTLSINISLEGDNTATDCIKAIQKLNEQQVDIILIMRGGGNTSGMSDSFDTIELFESIRNSNVPIITAIGHAADKGDNLLITEISDLNYSTPTTAATDMRYTFMKPVLDKIDKIIDEFINNGTEYFNEEIDKNYLKLLTLLDNYKKNTFHGPLITLEDDDEYITVIKDDTAYKIKIILDDQQEIPIDYEKLQLFDKSILYKNIDDMLIHLESLNLDNKENFSKTIDNICRWDKKLKEFETITSSRIWPEDLPESPDDWDCDCGGFEVITRWRDAGGINYLSTYINYIYYMLLYYKLILTGDIVDESITDAYNFIKNY